MIKISDEQAAELGVSNFEELKAKLSAIDGAKAENRAMTGRITILETGLTEIRAAISALPKIDTAALKTEILAAAKTDSLTIAAQEVSKAVARAGGKGIAGNKDETNGSETKTEIAPDDYKAQWDASKHLRDEFNGKFSTYEAFMKADRDGRNVERSTKPATK